MVLVVNKKTREQMEDNLSLFLLEQTAVFVSWLVEILEKLQTLSVPTKGKIVVVCGTAGSYLS